MKKKKRKPQNRSGLLGLGEGFPRRTGGVEQRAVRKVPERCDKCGNRMLQLIGREIHCPGTRGGCGRTWFLIKEDGGPELLRPDQETERRGGRLGAARRGSRRAGPRNRPPERPGAGQEAQ